MVMLHNKATSVLYMVQELDMWCNDEEPCSVWGLFQDAIPAACIYLIVVDGDEVFEWSAENQVPGARNGPACSRGF